MGLAARSKNGCFGEYIAAYPSNLIKINDDKYKLSFNEAASLPMVGTTSYQALMNVCKLKKFLDYNEKNVNLLKNKKVVILGGSTACGMIAIQICKALSIGSIIVTSSREDMCFKLGATKVINYKKFIGDDKKWYQDINSHEFNTFDIVYDCVGGINYWNESREYLLKKNGIYVTIVGDKSDGVLTFGGVIKLIGKMIYRSIMYSQEYKLFQVSTGHEYLKEFFQFAKKHSITIAMDQDSPFELNEQSVYKMFEKSMQFKSHGKLVLQICNES